MGLGVCYEFNGSKILSQNINELKTIMIIHFVAISFLLEVCCHACLFPFRRDLTENSYASTFLSLWMFRPCPQKKEKGSHSLGSQLNFKHHGYSRAVTEKLHYTFTCGTWAKERKKPKSSGLLIVKYLKIFWSSGFQWFKCPIQ